MADTVNSETLEGSEAGAEGVVSARDRFQRLSEDVQNRYRKVSEDVRRGAERAQEEIRRGAEVAREKYQETAEKAREGYDRVRRDASRLSHDVGTYVQDNPGKSVLIAAAAGFVLGLIVSKSRSDDE